MTTIDEPRAVRPEHPGDLMTVLPADAASLRPVRKLVRTWLNGQGWPEDEAEDVELAVNEAVANVVDHAYHPGTAGTVTLHAWIRRTAGARRVVATVLDRGRWGAHQPATPPAHTRGHGLAVMSGCMEEMHIQRGTAGTTVVLVSRPVGAAPDVTAAQEVSAVGPPA
ncbi:ATP-binding protein [Pseudonocardia broussonetiae]|uniref:ATP-binding protein n=1 Tax=Pseudonocardia broussonetiae TaxID=2736640 RepID=A0A6M6JJF9_9PSEU|nr:ATP-binding protein [Pseudonocardia broussonetiae]QJY47556.1 ATP-binding protein [Pseudonocardia broussonetiae]